MDESASAAVASKYRLMFPLSPRLRHRIVIVGLIMFGAGLVAGGYAIRPPAYPATAIVDAPAVASYRDLGVNTGSVSARISVLEARQARANYEQSLLLAAMRASHDRESIVKATRFRRSLPRLSLRRAGQSNIVRLIAVAAAPGEAAALANAAARILVLQERDGWRANVQTLAKSGFVPTDLLEAGSQISIVSEARPPKRQSRFKHVIAGIMGALLLISAALCSAVLAAEWWFRGRDETCGGDSISDLEVSVVGLLRVAAKATQNSADDKDQASFVVAPELWSYLEAYASSDSRESTVEHLVILLAPCDSIVRFDAEGGSRCRSAATYFARLAAERGHKTLLVDANTASDQWRSGRGLGLPRLPGFAEAISGSVIASDWLLQDDANPDLTALSAGRLTLRDAQLSGESMHGFLARCSAYADWIVVNAGPVLGDESLREFWSGVSLWADVAFVINEYGLAAQDIAREAAAALLIEQIPVIGQFTWCEVEADRGHVSARRGNAELHGEDN